MNFISPKKLRPNSRVAIVAPSSPFMTDEVQVGLDIIRECGLQPVLGPCVKNLRSSTDHAAPLQERVEELNWAFSDPKIHGIVSVCGGEGCAAILPYLDYDVIRETKKAFVGMSDLTAINTGLLTEAGLISFNAQSASIRLNKGRKIREDDSASLRKTIQMLMSDQVWGETPFDFNPYFPRTVCGGTVKGYVVGGNLDTFSRLIGTPYMPDLSGAILFIEDVHKGGESVSRALIHMRLAGIFDQVTGIVIGEFVDVPKKEEPKVPAIEDVIIDNFSNGPPCVYGYSFAHGSLTSPIPIGAPCFLDADNRIVSFNFKMSSNL